MEEAYIDTGFEEENEVPSRKLTVGELRRGERELPCSGGRILKHDLLREISKRFESIDEQRFLNSCLVDNWQREKFNRDEYYPISISYYAEKQNISLGKAYTELIELAEKYTAKLEIPLEGKKVWRTQIVYSYKKDPENLTLEIKFNEEIIPYLSGDMIAGTYATYDARLAGIPSNKRYIMSEILQRNIWQIRKKGSFILTLEEIRRGLNLDEGEYKQYGDLYTRILKPTLKDMAKIQGEYILMKKKKVGIIFTGTTKEVFEDNYGEF